MIVVIAGTRTINDYSLVCKIIENSGFADKITAVLCGASYEEYAAYLAGKKEANVDILGARWAKARSILVVHYEARWDDLKAPGAIIRQDKKTGKFYNAKAGPDRNQRMIDEAEGLILIWDGKSPGSSDVKRRAVKKGIKPYEKIVGRPPAKRNS